MSIKSSKDCIRSIDVDETVSKFTFNTALGRSVTFGDGTSTGNTTHIEFPDSCMSGMTGHHYDSNHTNYLSFYYTNVAELPINKTVYPTYSLIKQNVGCDDGGKL